MVFLTVEQSISDPFACSFLKRNGERTEERGERERRRGEEEEGREESVQRDKIQVPPPALNNSRSFTPVGVILPFPSQ